MDIQAFYLLFEVGLIFILLFGFAVLFALALVVRDVDAIKRGPFLFLIETVLVALLPAVPFLFFVISRGIPLEVAAAWVYGLSAKFAVFHLLFQVSGFYTYMFA
jgi:hypothetical protein